MASEYDAQERGSNDDYARYLAGMDASMRQKVALTAAHLLCAGKIADMGTGSGGASHALALLYPRLRVVGVDVAETMVELAQKRFELSNLSFVVGDAATQVFPEGSLDGVLASSMLHHVTSFGGYDHDAARRALHVQTQQLRAHGILVVRDFVAPDEQDVQLDLPTDDGDESDDPRRCSSACLFERFAREFRSLHTAPGFPLAPGKALPDGRRRYRTSAKLATEFVLRKDYRADWESEVKEEYTYFSQARFEAVFAELGLRVLGSTPISNPWIVTHRYEGKFALHDENGKTLPFPPTNYLIVGERVPADCGVTFVPGEVREGLGFLHMEHHRDVRTGALRDLVRRPNTTLDVVPWFEERGTLHVLSRTSYPRPVLTAEPLAARPLDGSRACPWSVEPLSFMQRDRPLADTIADALADYARIDEDAIVSFEAGSDYYPSPGGVAERVESMFVEVSPTFVQRDVGARSGFSTSGRVQAIEAEQLLRAAQVGGLSDARLELNVYDLLLRKRRALGPWLGAELSLCEREAPAHAEAAATLLSRPKRRMFRRATENPRPFLSLSCRTFHELDARGEVIASQPLEYVMPRNHAAVTVSVALLRKHAGVVYLGIDDDDLPAAQCFHGCSNLLVIPAYRLPASACDGAGAAEFVRERLRADYGVELGPPKALGGKYHPTPGVTPEVVHPWFAEVEREVPAPRFLHFVPLAELLERPSALRDGHLRIACLRAAHALGAFGSAAGGAP